MPVVQDLSFGLDEDFKPRKSKAPFVAAAAVLLLVGGALAAAKFGSGGEITAPIATPAAAPVALSTATSVVATPAAAPAPTPAPAEATPSASDKPAENTRLADDVKSKLKDADKARADKKKAGKVSRGRAPATSKSSSNVFRSGGNVNDPLNSKL